MEEIIELQETETKKLESSTTIKDTEVIEVVGYWTCDACGGDSDTGCLMSDPQNCVRY